MPHDQKKNSEEILEVWTNLKDKIKLKNQQLIQTQTELQKEKGWWDKWFSEEEGKLYRFSNFPELEKIVNKYHISTSSGWGIIGDYINTNSGQETLGIKEFERNYGSRRVVKVLYEYYRDK